MILVEIRVFQLTTQKNKNKLLMDNFLRNRRETFSMYKVQLMESSLIILFWNIGIYLYLYYKSCVWLCDPTNGSLPDLSVHGIFQARILDQVAISYFRWSPDPGIETGSPVYLALQINSLLLSHQRKTFIFYFLIDFNKNESENLINQVWLVIFFFFFFFGERMWAWT